MKNLSNRRRGGAMLELAFYLPWIFFFFICALDWGFYAYALVSVENAARVACLYTSANSGQVADSTTACSLVIAELKNLPNIGSSVTTCGGTSPVSVSATSVSGPDGNPASQVTVTYTTVNLIPIPGFLQGQFTWNRSVTMGLRSSP
jgi:Flp pilus assembly protein TadG